MVRMFKNFLGLMLVALATTNAPAFSLLGPAPSSGTAPDGYQQPVIGYHLDGEIGGPKNLTEEYRWNTPILNFAMDANFFDYYGSNGAVAIEQAIAILNGVSNVSRYTPSMNELPLTSSRVNFQARALGLVDLKSVALSFVVEELGLAQPDRFTWCIRDRRTLPGASCPAMQYDIIKRNYDPETGLPTSYVNGSLYSYRIFEICTGDNPLADAVEIPVDPLSFNFTAVASQLTRRQEGIYRTGLTRDDVGGLRYMIRTNNINFEAVSSDSVLLQTNLNTVELLTTSDLGVLVAASQTNSAAALTGLFPGLEVASTITYFTNVVTTNLNITFVNYPWDPVGTPAHVLLTTTFTTNVASRFIHSFANVITNAHFTNFSLTVATTNVVLSPYAPVGSGVLQTNVTQTTTVTPGVSGDYYLLLAGECTPRIVSTQLVSLVTSSSLNSFGTNPAGDGQTFSQSLVTYFTNRTFVVNPCDRLTGTVGLRQGMDKFTFVRQNYDSLLGRFFQPITNRYTLVGITNSATVSQTFERVVTRPDFLFSAEERMLPDEAWLSVGFRTIPGRGNGYNTDNILNPGAVDGPGTRQPFVEITFNKVGPLYRNIGPSFLTEANQTTNFIWGSFDGSTNAPIVYPSSSSLANLENLVLIQINPSVLAIGTAGLAYNSAFSVTGGQSPYSFAIAPGSGALPSGLSLSSTGVISGIPANSGIFDIVVRMTDSSSRTVDKPYALTINP